MGSIWQDVKYAVRMLGKSRWVTAAAVASLALGIGANTTIFSAVNALLLRPLAVERVEELASVYGRTKEVRFAALSYSDYADLRARNDVFADVAAFETIPVSLGFGEENQMVIGEIVSGNYFDTLGVKMARGRAFLAEEDRTPLSHPVVVVSEQIWKRKFASDPELVGRTIAVNGEAFTVVGIAPASFTGTLKGIRVGVWVPMMMQGKIRSPGEDLLNDRGRKWINNAVGRLKPGVSLAQARANVELVGRQIAQEYPEANREFALVTVATSGVSIHPQADAGLLFVSALVLVVVSLVLLIACANVANLLLARAAARRKEIAVRVSLGASRWRLVRMLLTESVLLAVAGGAAGLAVAVWVTGALTRALTSTRLPVPVEVALEFGPDWRVFLFALAVSVVTGAVFGLAPAMQASRQAPVEALKDEGSAGAGGRRRARMRSALVVAQVALSAVLLVAAGLFLRSLQKMNAVDAGFDAEPVAVASLDVGLRGMNEAQGRAFYEQVVERIGSMPGVESASLTVHVPLLFSLRSTKVEPIGSGSDPELKAMEAGTTSVMPGYFATMKIPMVRGRDFSRVDGEKAAGGW